MSDRETGPSTPYTLLPYVREGFSPNREYDPTTSTLEGRNEITVRTDVDGRKRGGDGTETRSPEVDLRMYGPGDVSGIDRRQVVKTVPTEETTTFPPNYLPHIEFFRPDLPWLFSPESANESEADRLRPWMALVVVPRDGKATVEPAGTRPNPVLKTPTGELPPVEESWAWTHVQVVGDVFAEGVLADQRRELFRSDSDQTVSRLLCPRKLSRGTRYVACVVPTFEPGRKAGLGKAPFGDLGADETPTIAPAWDASADGTIKLPVYFRWEFATGDRGDFEAALDKLSPRNLSKPEYGVGYKEFDIAEPGPAPLRTTGTATAKVGGALTTVGTELDEWGKAATLHDLLTAPDDVVGTPHDSPARNLPVVGPPAYGKFPPLAFDWPADPADGDRLEWLAELNLSPRYRVAAGLGTEVVREHQERLVEEAWAQFENLDDRTRNRLDRHNLGREVEETVQRTLDSIDHARKFREIERVREAVRVQGVLDRLHDEGGVPEPGGGAVDPEGWRYGFGRDVVESVLRNGDMSTATEDVLGALGERTQSERNDAIQPGVLSRVFANDPGAFVTMANELGRVRQRRAVERGTAEGQPLRGDGGAEALPERVPDFGSLTRLDATTRPSGTLAKRASGSADISAVRTALFADGPVPDAPAWQRDEAGNPMPLPEALQTLDDEAKAAPRALLQVRALRAEAEAVGERLMTAEAELGESDEASGDGQFAAADRLLDDPPVSEGADLLGDLVSAAHRAVVGAVAADIDAVSSELTQETVETTFSRVETASEVLAASVFRADAAARAVRGDGEQPDDDVPETIQRMDLAAGREAATAVVERAAALEAYVPAVTPASTDPTATLEDWPPGTETAPTRELLYNDLALRDQPDLPGMLDGDRWTVSKAGHAVFDVDGSTDALAGVEDAMGGGPMAAPEFEWPMFEPLKELSTEHVLPGVGEVPNNTIGALTTNREFIEAYMAGLSHEFGRELLWREYPTDRRATYFRTFWDYDGPGGKSAPHDIRKIHRWDGALGSNPPGGETDFERAVLLVKGDLLQAFPDTRVYMVPAVAERRSDAPAPDEAESGHDIWDRKPLFEIEAFDPENTSVYDGTESPGGYAPEGRSGATFETREDTGTRHVAPKEPVVHGKLGDSVTFLLFDLDTDAARGRDFTFDGNLEPEYPDQLGWFFVFEEPVGEIRFGFDANAELVGDDEQIREAAHPSGEKYGSLYTDVGSYPAKVDLGSSKRRGTESGTLPEGCKVWQEGVGEETGWSGLSWGHLARHDDMPSSKDDREAQIDAEQKLVDDIGHVRVTGEQSHAPAGVNDGVDDDTPWSTDEATWGTNGANMARITWQHPVRGAYHVDDLLPADAGNVGGESE